MADSKHFNSKDLTECGICLSTIEDPKALPCLHTYCLNCLTEWAKKGEKDQIKCPICAQDIPLPSDGVKGFRTNFFINTLKDRRATAEKLQAKDAMIPCTCCGAVDHKADAYCTSCGGFVCRECVGVHSKIYILSNHKLIPFEDLRSGKVDIRGLSHHKFCKTHESQILWFYCETCGVLICHNCTVVDHPSSSHVLVNLESATEGQKKEMEQLIQDCENVKKTVAVALKEIESVLVLLKENVTITETHIDQSFDQYKNTFLRLLEKEKSNMKLEMSQAASQRKKQLDAQKVDIQLQETRLDTALQMASEVTRTGSDYDLAVAYTSLKSSLVQLRDMKPTPIHRHLGEMQFKPKQVSPPALPSLGSLSLGCRKDGVGVWKLEKEFGNEGEGKLSYGHGIAVAPNRDICVADYGTSSVKIYNQTGEFKYTLTEKLTNSLLWDIVVSQHGVLYVTDRTQYVNVYNDKGNFTNQFTTKSPLNTTAAQRTTDCLGGLALDNHGHILVGEWNNMYISKHQLDGSHITSFKVTIQPWCIAVSSLGRIIISQCRPGVLLYFSGVVQVLDENGGLLHQLKPPENTSWYPLGVCCTNNNYIYISNKARGEILSYSLESGSYVGCITKEVMLPKGLALADDDRKLIVAQQHSVKIFSLQ